MKTGIHDVPEAEYFADPALSQSGAKTLLECPARYRWQLDHPRPPKDAFDLGHAAHHLLLGVGSELVVVEAADWRTKAAQEAKAAAREAGQVPLLRKDFEATFAMAEAVLAHPLARRLLESEGDVEQSGWWVDVASDGTEVECRGRFDKITTTTEGLPCLVDLKTSAKSASADAFTRSVIDFRYDLQEDWYSSGFETITGQRPAFLFVVVETAEPHFVGVHSLDDAFRARGARLRMAALDRFVACAAADEWPAHGDGINIITPPRWAA